MNTDDSDMDQREDNTTDGAGLALPFDVITFLLGIWRRKLILFAFTAAAIAIGFAASAVLSSREYESTAVLLYTPALLEDDGAATDVPTLQTLVNLFKTRDNLEAVRENLGLSVRIEAIGAATAVELRRNTTLLEIRTRWDEAETAAAIANTLYTCFFESFANLQQRKRTQGREDLQARLAEINADLDRREKELQQFVLENNIVDLDKEIQWFIQQLGSLERQHDDARIRLESTRRQRSEIIHILEDIEKTARQQSSALAAQTTSITETNVQIQRLRELINDTRQARARAADLMVKEEDLKRARQLRQLDAISQADFDRITAEYERAKALAFDSEEIEAWKAEIQRLDQAVVPESGAGSTPSGDVLRSVMIKAIDLRLEETALTEQTRALAESRDRVQERLTAIPMIRHAHADQERRMSALLAERQRLLGRIATVNRQLEALQLPFRVVSEARASLYPRRSNRKLIFAGIAFVGMALGGLVVILLELLDFTIKSEGSLRAALRIRPLGILPHEKNTDALLPGPHQSATQRDAYRQLALALRRELPAAGICIVMTGGGGAAGVSTVTLNLAAILQQRGENALIIDAHATPDNKTTPSLSVADFIEAPTDSIRGLDHYLALPADTEPSPYKLTIAASAIARVRATIEPEQLVSENMRTLLSWARSNFTITLLDAPPLADSIASEYLATQADAIVYIVRAGQRNILAEKRCLQRVRETGTAIPGAVLIDIRKPYLHA